VLYSLDLSKTPDPGRRADGDYVVSWIRPYEQGRIFYTSLGHCATAYTNPAVLKHYLAGIQYAIGDLPAE
jgi:type 1 glutamine amidotransferase